jgi:hypothetical protein
MSEMQTAIVVDPGSYYAYEGIGLNVIQVVLMETAEEENSEYPISDAINEARFALFCEEQPIPPHEVLAAVVARMRRQRKEVRKSVLHHLRRCPGCEECLPPSPESFIEEAC